MSNTFAKPKKMHGFLGISLIAIFLITAVVLDYKVSNKSVAVNNKAPAVAAFSLSTLKTNLEQKYPNLISTAIDQNNQIGYPIRGQNFNVLLPLGLNSLTLKYDQTTNESSAYSYLYKTAPYISAYFKSKSFVEEQGTNTYLSSTYFYINNKDICQVTTYSLVDINCDLKTNVDAIAHAVEPLLYLYEAVSPTTGINTASSPNISASKTEGYSMASMDVFNNAGEARLDYYKAPNGTWQMIPLTWYNDPHENASITPNCQDFESITAVSQAYRGTACYNSTNRRFSSIQ